jgi:hypothetical protein
MQQIQMLQNQMLAMNSGMYSVYPYNMPPFMNPLNPNYPFLLEQMKNNPYMMNMFPSAMMPNCIPFSKLPFNKNGQPDQKKDET